MNTKNYVECSFKHSFQLAPKGQKERLKMRKSKNQMKGANWKIIRLLKKNRMM